MSVSRSAPCSNHLLLALPAKALRALIDEKALEQVELRLGEVLHEPGLAIEYVYFPEVCVISLMAVAEGRMTLEVGLVGAEGMAGIAVAMGSAVSPVRTLVRRDGSAMRACSRPRRSGSRRPRTRWQT